MSAKIEWSAIPKLGDGETKFRIWKFRASNALKACDLFRVVSGAEPRPEAVEEDQKSWDQADSEAKLNLSLIISDPLLDTLRHFPTSKEMWDTLNLIHESPKDVTVMWSEVFGYKAKKNKPPLQAYWDLRTMAYEIRQAGGTVNEVEENLLVFKIVDCLPDEVEKYYRFKEKWRMFPKLLNLESLFHKLRELG